MMAIKRDEKRFDFFPSFVSDNPKKILVLIVLFTLVMGYFASNMTMGTEEESFNPESKKAEWLDEIQNDFGTTGEAVQIAFVADNGSVFSKKVLMDMLQTKKAIIESDQINRTLKSTNSIPNGMRTLADSVITANLTLQIEDVLIQQSRKIPGMYYSMENQTAMYSSMYSSLENTSNLIRSKDRRIRENATLELTSMANIISEPKSWTAVQSPKYRQDFQNLIYLMSTQPGATQKIIKVSSDIIANMTEDSITPGTDREHFVGLLSGMKNIFLNRPSKLEAKYNTQAFLKFMEISNHLANVDTDTDLRFDIPSLDLTYQEKIDKLSNMSDREIKNTVEDTIEHDSKPLENSIDKAVKNFDKIEAASQEGLSTLTDLNETLSQIIGHYYKNGQMNVVKTLGEYQRSVLVNRTVLKRTRSMMNSTNERIRSARYLPRMIEGLGKSISMSVSKDFPEDNLNNGNIRAESAIGLIQMNSSIDSDTRKEAQEQIIDLSHKYCDHSEPKVFAQQIMMKQINDSANQSMNTLLPIAFAFVVIVLLIIYRTVIETALSLLSLVFAIIWTFGAGVILGYKFNPMIIAVPILITGLVIDYGIHMVMRYREEKEKGKISSESTKIAIATVGGALLLTTMTTAIGFLSNTFSNISVMRHFGILAAVGISSSFILMVAFLPSVIQIVEGWREKRKSKERSRASKKLEEHGGNIVSSILSTSTDASDKHPWIVMLVVLLITVSATYGVVNIDTTFNIQDFLPEDRSQSENIEYISSNFNISTSYAYILTEGDLTDPNYLEAVNETIKNAVDVEMLLPQDGTSSPLTVLREYGTASVGSTKYNKTIVSAFSRSDKDGDSIPDRNISHLYDLLYSNKNSRSAIQNVLYKTNDGSYTKGVLKFKENANKITTNIDNAEVMEEELKEDAEPLKKAGFTAKVTSSNIIGQDTTEELSETQINSLIATIIIVAVLLTVVFYFLHGSKVLGVLTTLPVSIVTIWIVGTMYIMDVPLNVMTVSITALTVGMGVDYSIHITHRFTEEKEEEDNLFDAMHDTVQNTGAALFGSAATTMGAFGILSTSEILPLSQFGYITALAIGYSFLVAVFVLPSALMVWAKCCRTDEEERKELPVLKKKQ